MTLNSKGTFNLVLILGVFVLTLARTGFASSSFFETTVIATGVGAVLGASTLPFYDVPGEHLKNVGIGAGAGFLTGVGIWAYGKYIRKSNDSYSSTSGSAIPQIGLNPIGLRSVHATRSLSPSLHLRWELPSAF